MRVSSVDCSPARQRISTFSPGYVHYHRIKLGASFTWDRYIVMIQHHTGGKKEQLGRPLTIDTYRFFHSLQLRIQGRGPGDPGSPLFLDQKSFFWDQPTAPHLISGSWSSGPPLSEGLDPPLACSIVFQRNTCISHSVSEFTDKASIVRDNAS